MDKRLLMERRIILSHHTYLSHKIKATFQDPERMLIWFPERNGDMDA